MGKEKTRVQLDLYKQEVQVLDRLRDNLELNSRADAVRVALGILEWMESEIQEGRKIFSIGDEEIVPLIIPNLTNRSNHGVPHK